MNSTFEKIFHHEALVNCPPVFVEVGASGGVYKKLRPLAPYLIYVGFDADQREMAITSRESKIYKRAIILPYLVDEETAKDKIFYLTKSPFCSSLLEPDHQALNDWSFASLFQTENKRIYHTIMLKKALQEIGITKIDWFKTDSQGIDLRLFKNLGEDCIKRVLVAEFEPGIIDAYKNEDKLHQLMAYMDHMPFWVSNINICGTQRISPYSLDRFIPKKEQRRVVNNLPVSPCWAEITYSNNFQYLNLTMRDFFLGWVFLSVQNQHGAALEVAAHGFEQFKDSLFIKLKEESLKALKPSKWKMFRFK